MDARHRQPGQPPQPASVSVLAPRRGRCGLRLALAALCLAAACSGERQPLPPVSSGELEPAGAELEQLAALGYLGTTDETAAGPSGVILHRPDAVQPGLNLWASGHAPEALLTDLEGRVRHRWRWLPPEGEADRYMRPQRRHWRRVHALPGGDLLAIFEGRSLLKLDRESNLQWAYFGRPHHDLEVLPDGTILVLTRETRAVAWLPQGEPVLEDFLTWLAPDGRELRRVSLLTCFESSPFGRFWEEAGARSGDVLHTNSVQRLDEALAAGVPGFEAGQVLISMRTPSALAVVDPEAERAVWLHRGDFAHQHHARLLPSGRILFLDNGDETRGSRLLELDPVTRAVRWVYRGSATEPFFTALRGAVQRLPNGNSLVTETDRGRVFEVTSAGERVWVFVSPYTATRHTTPGSDGKRSTVSGMERLPATYGQAWLAPAGGDVPDVAALGPSG